MMWHMFDGFGFLWGGMWLMMFTPVIVITLVIILIIKLFQGNKTNTIQEDLAIKILKERLAKGEIDEEEYNRKMELLKKK
ncbi:MAG: SHOCT domain-containing protein [Fusobacteriaceae bacterium]|nr:SHOCT domain-containing protein [Fusobacteriaceae bacterium]MBN2837187.1 SHOCT domain-containing protein [Fusobacteriaceae bacterium]